MAKAWSPREPREGDWYTRDDIQKTLAPVTWRRYTPATGADVQQGVAADGAAPRS
jgi:hypothetical protein